MSIFARYKGVFIKAAILSTALLLYCWQFASCNIMGASPSDASDVPKRAEQVLSDAITPSVSAKSAVLIDGESGELLCSKNPDERLPMASTTKIMTALVAIEEGDLASEVTIPREAVGVEGSSIYLYEGEKLTLEELLYAVLLESANDAATAVAIHISGSVEGFAALMNEKAAKLGLENTHFENPHGLDSAQHYTTARELAIIAAEAMKNPKLREIASTKKKTIPLNDTEGVRLLINHNRLLKSYNGAIGVKTGYTKKSGRCLVSAAERDGLTLICVTLSAPDDWRDHTSLLDYGFSNYESRVLCVKDEMRQVLPVVGGKSDYVTLTNTNEIRITLPKGAPRVECQIETRQFEYAPVCEGDTLGRAVYLLDGKEIASTPIVASYSVNKTKSKNSLWEMITFPFNK